MDINLLRTFHAVARFGRFKTAAAHVHRSASAVTAQIQKLESRLGRTLFIRNNQGVELTRAGRHLLADTREFLLLHDKLLASMSPQRIAGNIRVGVPDGYAAQFVSEFLPQLIEANPRLEVEVEARSSAELLDMFARQQLDLTLAVSRQKLDQGELLFMTQPQWVAAARFEHDKRLPVPVALQLQGCPYRESALHELKAHDIEYRILLESSNWQAVEACLRSGLAVGIMEQASGDMALPAPAGVRWPALLAHGVYLLTDSAHPLVLPIRDIVKTTFRTDGWVPAR
ncbi:LysR family transcriptional regulator [Alcaligenes sp. WGS1538]|uniref:LysR family transcriptional regulator n=1 Tax=Alcaligenes sp. WGS1538 TaxID=3366811 RepID=UPI00372D1555